MYSDLTPGNRRVGGAMDHGADYAGGYVFNIQYNYIHDYGGDILNDFGAVYLGSRCSRK